jgi:hypothetical protein
MAQVEVADGRLVIRLLDRSDRLWAFRSELEVPLDHVRGVGVDPDRVRAPWSGLPVRDPGSWAPGVLAAGTVHQEGGWAFWDVRGPSGPSSSTSPMSASPAWSWRSTTRRPPRRRSARLSTAAPPRRPAERPRAVGEGQRPVVLALLAVLALLVPTLAIAH